MQGSLEPRPRCLTFPLLEASVSQNVLFETTGEKEGRIHRTRANPDPFKVKEGVADC